MTDLAAAYCPELAVAATTTATTVESELKHLMGQPSSRSEQLLHVMGLVLLLLLLLFLFLLPVKLQEPLSTVSAVGVLVGVLVFVATISILMFDEPLSSSTTAGIVVVTCNLQIIFDPIDFFYQYCLLSLALLLLLLLLMLLSCH
jgi:multidrug transporter EmrE-like cation transporter